MTKKKVSAAHLRANRNYDKRNENKTRYDTAKRNARRFIKPGKGSAMQTAIDEYGGQIYDNDLRDLGFMIQQRLDERKKEK